MQIYHYDQITGEFIKEGTADPNPRNPANPIIPAFATNIAPLPEKEGYQVIFDGEGWGYVKIPKPEPEPVPTAEEIQAQVKKQAITTIQGILDSKAQEYGFDSIHTAAVWTISKNPARKARADALVAWADSVWDFAESEWTNQEKGTPTFTDLPSFLAALPQFGGVA
jgi:hypothetical protein